MADLAFIVVTVAFFALCAALVVGCDRIVRAGQDERLSSATEPDDAPERVAA